jgi:hypothetical protein
VNKRFSLLCLLFFFLCFLLPAYDFGLLLNQKAGYDGVGGAGQDDRSGFDYSIGAVPRFSGLIGQTGDFIISAGFEADYSGHPGRDGWSFVPELLRAELSFSPGDWNFEIGRMYHCDPLGFVAEGLFDGVKAEYYSDAGIFSAGAWYTGLLYKKRDKIEMTQEESEANSAPLDYDDIAGTYFAPRRFLSALGWEHLGLPVKTRVSVLGQFDFFADEPLNSQYAVVKLTLPVKAFSFDLGGCFELTENGGKTKTAFSAEAAAAYTFPARIKSRLSLLARYSSGAFTPFTTESQGNIIDAKLSGLSVISLEYAIRLPHDFSAGIASTYFVRSDLKAYNGYPLSSGSKLSGDSGSGYFLGNEFFARLLWSPASDLQINLGGGLFMPSLGDAAPNAGNSWRVELNAVFSLL